MKSGTRYVIGVALALAALGVFASASAARPSGGAAPTLRPGLSDFGLPHSKIVVPSQARTASTPQLKPGLSDFGLAYTGITVPPASTRTSSALQPVESRQPGFDWGDAGVGAAAMLGIVLIVAGLGAGLVVRGHRRELRSA